MKFRVHGVNRETGEERILDLEAVDAKDANRQADLMGYIVAPANTSAVREEPAVADAMRANRGGSARGSPLRWFGASTAAAIGVAGGLWIFTLTALLAGAWLAALGRERIMTSNAAAAHREPPGTEHLAGSMIAPGVKLLEIEFEKQLDTDDGELWSWRVKVENHGDMEARLACFPVSLDAQREWLRWGPGVEKTVPVLKTEEWFGLQHLPKRHVGKVKSRVMRFELQE